MWGRNMRRAVLTGALVLAGIAGGAFADQAGYGPARVFSHPHKASRGALAPVPDPAAGAPPANQASVTPAVGPDPTVTYECILSYPDQNFDLVAKGEGAERFCAEAVRTGNPLQRVNFITEGNSEICYANYKDADISVWDLDGSWDPTAKNTCKNLSKLTTVTYGSENEPVQS